MFLTSRRAARCNEWYRGRISGHSLTSTMRSNSTLLMPLGVEAGFDLLVAWLLWKAFFALIWLFSVVMAVDVIASVILRANDVLGDRTRPMAWTETCVIGLLMIVAGKLWDTAMALLYIFVGVGR